MERSDVETMMLTQQLQAFVRELLLARDPLEGWHLESRIETKDEQ